MVFRMSNKHTLDAGIEGVNVPVDDEDGVNVPVDDEEDVDQQTGIEDQMKHQ
jgi:hypothetical protein